MIKVEIALTREEATEFIAAMVIKNAMGRCYPESITDIVLLDVATKVIRITGDHKYKQSS